MRKNKKKEEQEQEVKTNKYIYDIYKLVVEINICISKRRFEYWKLFLIIINYFSNQID